MATRDGGSSKAAGKPELEIGQLQIVLDKLSPFAKWERLGLNLGLSQGQLDVIQADGTDSHDRLSKVIQEWLKRNYKDEVYGVPTWANLAKAIKPLDHTLALKIEDKHCPVEERDAGVQRPGDEGRRRQQSSSSCVSRKLLAYLVIPVVLAMVATWYFGGVAWFVKAPLAAPSPPPSYAVTCDWPKPNSDSVQLQVRPIKTELGVEEMSEKLKISVEQVGKALTAGERCNDPELQDKMHLVDTTVRKIKGNVNDVYGGFTTGANTALTDLKTMWVSATKGNMDEAVQRMKRVCETTENLALQLDSLKSSIWSKESELHRALENLRIYQERAKESLKSRQHKLREEKQDYEEQWNAAKSSATVAEEKARSAADNARKEIEAWNELKSKDVTFVSDDQNPFKKRRAQFLKEQQTYEAEAEDSRRIMEQTRLKISKIGKDNKTANSVFKCIGDAITKVNGAVGSASLPTVSVSLFEEGLKEECTDLHDEVKSIDSLALPKGTFPSQVCDKAKKLFVKWQALLKVSSAYSSSRSM